MTINSTANQLVLIQESYWGPTGPTQRTGLNYRSGDSLTAQTQNSTVLQIPAATTGQQINFATLFPTSLLPLFAYVTEVTSPLPLGFKFYTHTGSTSGEKIPVGPNGFFSWIGDGTTAPVPIYVDNAGATAIFLEVGLASN